MAKRFIIDITDLQWKALAWKHVDPHQFIDDFVTNRINLAMDEIATQEIKRRLADPTWTEPIPADKRQIFETLELKSALQLQKEDTVRILAMVENPDIGGAMPVPTNVSVKPAE
jgi:hypothetical protein